jgi:anti-sigma regulatory factor (Ser/Thr protein kinase)
MPRTSLEVDVRDVSQVGDARRRVLRAAQLAGLDEVAAGNAAIVATEMATNLMSHGGGGCVVARIADSAMELHAIDRGPGMDVAVCLRDGRSTRGTAGNGLGAIRRLSCAFDAYSDPRGSVVWARVGAAPPAQACEVGAICVPLAGESECGDDWTGALSDVGGYVLLVDGLGHGADAARAAFAAVDGARDEPPAAALDAVHRRMAGTRGGAGAFVRVDAAQRSLSYASVGNIAIHVVSHERSRGLPAQNGTLGIPPPVKIREAAVALDGATLVVMHSDGVATRWSLAEYPGLISRHAAVIAGVLWRDYRRSRDDGTVVVMRC